MDKIDIGDFDFEIQRWLSYPVTKQFFEDLNRLLEDKKSTLISYETRDHPQLERRYNYLMGQIVLLEHLISLEQYKIVEE